jgi:hypothetical protein
VGPMQVGVMATLLGVLLGGALQQLQASRTRRWQREDALRGVKRATFAEYLRSIRVGAGTPSHIPRSAASAVEEWLPHPPGAVRESPIRS